MDVGAFGGTSFNEYTKLYFHFSWTCFALGTLLNFFLIWLVCKKSWREMTSYKRVLVQTSLLDLYSLVLAALVQPIYIMLDGKMVIVQNGPFKTLEQPWNFVLMQFWVFGYYLSIVSNVVQFMYRYMALCRQVHLRLTKYAIIFLCGTLVVLTYNALLYYAAYPREQAFEQTKEVVGRFLGLNSTNDIVLSMIGTPHTYRCLVHCFYLLTVEVACYGTIAFCSLSIKRYVKKAYKDSGVQHSGVQRRRLEVDRQLTTTLFLQAVLPLFAVLIGLFCIVFCTSSILADRRMNIPIISYMTLPVPLIPVANPLITILVVKPFRTFVFMRNRSSARGSSTPPLQLEKEQAVATDTPPIPAITSVRPVTPMP